MGQEFSKIESNVTKRLIKCFYTCFKMRNNKIGQVIMPTGDDIE